MENKVKRKIVLRPSSRAVKIMALVGILLSVAALVALQWVRTGIQEQTEQKRQEAIDLEQKNADLESKLADMDAVDNVEDIARDQLGLVNPDAVIIEGK